MSALVLVPLVLIVAPQRPRAEKAASPRLSVEIAAPERLDVRHLSLEGFRVVVRNESDVPLRVWREWCSWGWFQLSFVVTDAAGTSFVVRKAERGWDKNFPDHWTLAPGEPLVLDVRLADASVWKSPVLLGVLRGKTVSVRAVFESGLDPEAKETRVWTGRAESARRSYRLQ